MRSRREVLSAMRSALPTALLVWVSAAALLELVLLVGLALGVPTDQLTRDPTAIMGAPFYLGTVSSLGVLLWAAAATVCVFSGVVVLRQGEPRNRDWQFLLCSGLLTSVLLLDDLFLLHDEVAPKYLGIQEEVVFGAYGALSLLYLLQFREEILRSRYPLLLGALGLFGVSVVTDALPFAFRHGLFVEDGSKFVGIATWLAYFADAASSPLRRLGASKAAGPEQREGAITSEGIYAPSLPGSSAGRRRAS